MKNLKKIILSILLLNLSFTQFSDNSEVSYEYNENIIKDNEVYILDNFTTMLEKYFKSTFFSNEFNHLNIPLKIHLIFERIHFAGENNYNMLTCQILVTNSYDQYYLIKSTNIPYHKGKTIYFNELNFDPLTSIFDYFAFLFVGYELDAYGLFLGDSYYSKALEICSMAIFSKYKKGWDTRKEHIRDIKNNEFLRNVRFTFYQTMEQFYSEEFISNILKDSTISILNDLQSIHHKIGYDKNTLKFIDSFKNEFIELFNYFELKDGIIFLYNYDSKNQNLYEQYLE